MKESLIEKYLITEKDKGYKIAKNPSDKLWYVVGHAGGKYWMPVSSGYKSKKQAEQHMEKQKMADIDAKSLIAGV